MKTDEELEAFFKDLVGDQLVVAYAKISALFVDLYKEIRDAAND